MCKAIKTRNDSDNLKFFVLPTLKKKIKIKTANAQSKSVAAHPCNRRFAATHLLSLAVTQIFIRFNYINAL